MKTYNNEPNFSIMLPGGCNAACQFCFWDRDSKVPKKNSNYLPVLAYTLANLPLQFTQISLTGGEPMLSPMLNNVLEIIRAYKPRYSNVIMSTNGTNILDNAKKLAGVVDHINLSRHHWNAHTNRAIFGGTYNVPMATVVEAIKVYGDLGIDISASCVINDGTTKEFTDRYIAWAKRCGFSAVRFRKENGSLGMTPVEKLYKSHRVLASGGCPACRSSMQEIDGMTVHWKSSVLEPTTAIKEVFELIYSPDGRVFRDWQFKKPQVIPLRKVSAPVFVTEAPVFVTETGCGVRHSAGCGVRPSSVCGRGSCNNSGCNGSRTLSSGC